MTNKILNNFFQLNIYLNDKKICRYYDTRLQLHLNIFLSILPVIFYKFWNTCATKIYSKTIRKWFMNKVFNCLVVLLGFAVSRSVFNEISKLHFCK